MKYINAATAAEKISDEKVMKGDSKFKLNNIYHGDCMSYLPSMADNSVDLTLTDIPYGEVNRADNGLRTLSKGGGRRTDI